MTLLEAHLATGATDPARFEDEAGIEFAKGQVEVKPMSRDGAEIEGNVILLLKLAGRKPNGWRVFGPSLGYKVYPEEPERFRKPDVSAILRSRVGADDEGFARIPADLAVEILSPHDSAYDMDIKVREYLAHGFRLVWVVYPVTKAVYAYTPDGRVEAFDGDDLITAGDVLPGFSCKVAEFFEV